MPRSKNRRKKKRPPPSSTSAIEKPIQNHRREIDAAAEMKTAIQYFKAGRLRRAEAACRNVLSETPEHPDALHLLGLVAHRAHQDEAAAGLIEKAVSLKPENSGYRNNLGNVYVALNRLDDAAACFKEASRIAPNTVEAYINLGNVQKYQGKTVAAEESYQRALTLDPCAISAYYNLSQLIRFKEKNDIFAALESIPEKRSLTDRQSTERHFALGKMFADIGDSEAAFNHYHAGNAYRKKTMAAPFDLDAFEKQIDLYIKVFDTEFFNRCKDMGDPTPLPIFIVGMPRSGTSLVEQILASHPGVFGAGELPLINQMVNRFLSAHRGLSFNRILEVFDENSIRKMARDYLDALAPLPAGTVRVTDKLPGNFLNLWFIACLFPHAKIIHCSRHPMDTCLSCYFTHFKQPLPYKNDLYTLGRYYRSYKRLMGHWKRVLPVSMIKIQYEALVDNHEALSRKMVASCDLEWDEKCLSFHENNRPVTTASGMQVRRKIYTGSVGRWKNYRRFLSPLIQGLGDPDTATG